MATIVNVHVAKTRLSKLLARVSPEEEVIIAKAGKPVARLVPIQRKVARRLPGSAKGQIRIAPDFEAPLTDDIVAEFYK